MDKKVVSLVLLCFLALAAFSPVVSAQIPVTIPNQGHFIAESIGDPETVDPAWAYDTASAMLIFNIYDTLVFFDRERTDEFIPVLATDWLINQPPHPDAPDGTVETWYFKIRLDDPGTPEFEGVYFHDGDVLTPQDVEYSFERWMVQDRSGGPTWMIYEPLTGGFHADMNWPEAPRNPIDRAVESNSTHVWFNLAMPYPPLMQILSQSWASVVSYDFCTAIGDWPGPGVAFEDRWTVGWHAYHDPEISPLDAAGNVECGTGPFMLDYWTHGVEWSIVRFADYWGQWPAPHSSGYLDRFTEKVVYEWGTRYADFIGGYADAVYVPRAYLPQMILNWPTKWYPGMPTNPEEYAEGIRCLPGLPTLVEANFFFNLNTNPASGYVGTGSFPDGIPLDFFSDPRIREAFAYSLNYTEFLETMFWGEAVQPSSCVPEGITYHNPENPVYSFNLTRAAELFQEASADPNSPAYQVWELGFTMTITYNIGNIPRETTAEMLATNVMTIFESAPGTADISVLGVPWPTYLGELVGYPLFRSLMPIFIIGWLADYPDAHNWVFPYMHTYGDFSYFQSYSNPVVDALVDAGISTPDDTTPYAGELDGPNPIALMNNAPDPDWRNWPTDASYYLANPPDTRWPRRSIYYALQLIYFEDCPSVGTVQAFGRHWERDWYQGWYYNTIYPGTYAYHIWKGLNGDIDGDNEVGVTDALKVVAHWNIPGVISGTLGYDVIADVGPVLQYPTPGVINIVDAGVVSAHYREYVP